MAKALNYRFFQLMLAYILVGCNSGEEYVYTEGFGHYMKRLYNEDLSQIEDRFYC
jgi:hypothetical protein